MSCMPKQHFLIPNGFQKRQVSGICIKNGIKNDSLATLLERSPLLYAVTDLYQPNSLRPQKHCDFTYIVALCGKRYVIKPPQAKDVHSIRLNTVHLFQQTLDCGLQFRSNLYEFEMWLLAVVACIENVLANVFKNRALKMFAKDKFWKIWKF